MANIPHNILKTAFSVATLCDFRELEMGKEKKMQLNFLEKLKPYLMLAKCSP